ncbi:MFS transporter [Flavobacterium sp. MC2016-06]|uniref:MFS transporter n=1 Tax=Flavobacterium sp. MC2016-06 TaxID=2676308 RepID=UPI0012BA7D39|nr:MFS transporter [Flavobacterium sp. MC2016-06]MBU3857905.1 MFS transporter [Flavobacterium sp. MC2016-06]
MNDNSIFKSWVPKWAIVIILFVCLLHSMILLGVYTSNVTYAASFLDIEPEDLQFAMCVTYGTLLATILIEARFSSFFPTKNYLMMVYSFIGITIVSSAYITNFYIFLLLRVAEGILMALPVITIRQLLIEQFKTKNAIIIGFSFYYGSLLLSTPFIMNIAVWFLDHYDWKYMLYVSGMLQVINVFLILITFKGHRITKKIPLYQIDWISYILVLTAILTGAYFFVYAEKKYWFESSQMVLMLMISLITAGLFVFKELSVKRPTFHFEVFKYANLRIGFLLFFLFYISRATLSLCHAAMFSIWNWDPSRVAGVQYINGLGNVIGLILGAFFLMKSISTKYIFIIGFSLIALFHFWFTFLFVPDIALSDIIIPYTLQGIGVGILFVPLILFTTSSVPSKMAVSSGIVGVSGRFWGSTIGFCIMQNAVLFLNKKHFLKLSQFVTDSSAETQETITKTSQSFMAKGYSLDESNALALKKVFSTVSKQATLLTNMEIYTTVGYGLLVLIVLIALNQHIKQTVNVVKSKVWIG